MCLISFATYIFTAIFVPTSQEHRGAPRARGRGAADAFGALRSLGLDNPPSLLVGALGMLQGVLQLRESLYSIQVVRIMQVCIIFVNDC